LLNGYSENNFRGDRQLMKRKILIVEDVKLNREIIKRILCNEYDILEAQNGQEALNIMDDKAAGLSAVLLDLSMPVMNGFEVLSHMRADPKLKQLPVIVTTGQTEDSSEVKALQMGANDYVSKPYNAAIIRQRIWNAINLQETAAVVNELRRDHLTGLYSRNTFIEIATTMIKDKGPGYYVMVCFDIDNFKIINDQYGTERGDEVLRYIAKTFREGFEPIGGICCRIMADNFAVLFPKTFVDTKERSQILRKATMLNSDSQKITFSIGRYYVDDINLSVSAMYDRAAMAKESVKGKYDKYIAVFDESMRNKLIQEQRIVSEMKTALDGGQFEAWMQPQYNHATGMLIGAEALVRWRHPERGLVSPGLFVPIFERNGFIYELDKYMWEQTCIYLHKWSRNGERPLPVSVNISRYDVFREDIIDVLSGLVKKYQVPVELLRLEITESAFSHDTAKIVDVVKKLIDLGFTVEIDDFGSGYSSLNTLKDVPAQIIKLDMKFMESSELSSRGAIS